VLHVAAHSARSLSSCANVCPLTRNSKTYVELLPCGICFGSALYKGFLVKNKHTCVALVCSLASDCITNCKQVLLLSYFPYPCPASYTCLTSCSSETCMFRMAHIARPPGQRGTSHVCIAHTGMHACLGLFHDLQV